MIKEPSSAQSSAPVTVPPDAAAPARVLAVVASLVTELQGALAPASVTLDQSLERDLGIGSLERVELLLRLEQAFGVRLTDAAMMEAETPRDLVRAILTGGPGPPERAPELLAPLGAGTAAPVGAATLVDALRWHVEREPERVHVFLREEDGSERPITYGALWERAVAVAGGLRERGAGPGETVALMLRTEEPFFAAFFGVLLAGAIPVPIYPPFRADRIEEYARRQIGILTNARARLLVTFAEAERVAVLLRPRAATVRAVTSVDELARTAARLLTASAGAADPALIQYTSGSTGDPKGVLLTHANLLANIRAIGEAIAIRPDDVGVSWLPLYHDMGLIGAWLSALYFGIPIAILSPLAFLARPARWLWALHAHRGTVSPAPNFAYDLCVRKIADDEIRGLDLSSWRLAFNGSEPVSAETIERFTRRFAPYGFRPEAMCPTYGLAEASVGLTVAPLARRPRMDGRIVSCGRPLSGHEVRIVDAAGRPVSERSEGRIEFRGPSVTRGYFRNPEATRATFRDGWCDSGDLGYWAGGELFVTGRRKDIIIKAGRNLHPQEIEELVGDIPGVRKGCVAAFGVADATIGTERLVVVVESRETAPQARLQLRAAIVDRVVVAVGLPPDTVLVVAPRTVLKTPSGKVRRSATREAYLAGRLEARRSPRVQWLRLVWQAVVARLGRLPRQGAALAYGPSRCGAPGALGIRPPLAGCAASGPYRAALVPDRAGARGLLPQGRRAREPPRDRTGSVRRKPRELPGRGRPPCGDSRAVPVRCQARARPGAADRRRDRQGRPPHRGPRRSFARRGRRRAGHACAARRRFALLLSRGDVRPRARRAPVQARRLQGRGRGQVRRGPGRAPRDARHPPRGHLAAASRGDHRHDRRADHARRNRVAGNGAAARSRACRDRTGLGRGARRGARYIFLIFRDFAPQTVRGGRSACMRTESFLSVTWAVFCRRRTRADDTTSTGGRPAFLDRGA